MKKQYFLSLIIFVFASVFLNEIMSNSGGAPAGRTGSPIDLGTCKQAGCHNSFDLNSGDANISLTSNVPSTGFVPNDTFTITLGIGEMGKVRFGFEAMVYGVNLGTGAGTWVITDSNRTIVRPGPNANYFTHTRAGNANMDTATWQLDWVAPDDESEVIIYTAMMSSNANNNNSGDFIYTLTDTLSQSTVSVDPLRYTLPARIFPNLVTDRFNVEIETESFQFLDLKVIDANGREVYDLLDHLYPGVYRTTVETAGWPSGWYLVDLRAGKKRSRHKIIVK